jgi:hypothetical protein
MSLEQSVSYFRPRIDGPELRIENAVVTHFTRLFERNDWPLWVGGSVPIGAGFPDIVSAWYDPNVVSLAEFDVSDGHILAYLRSVRKATIDTMSDRLHYPIKQLKTRIESLENSQVVSTTGRAYSISQNWREILPEVVTVEAKVSDWQAAIQQAIRNRIFSHRSYTAFPEHVAERVLSDSRFAMHGVGVLAVTPGGDVYLAREARRNRPSVWNYYFHLAAITASDINARITECHSSLT